MFGLSSNVKESLGSTVEDMFDRIALGFIGNIPALAGKKNLIISSEMNFGLAHLFVQAMGNRAPNDLEKDFLKSLLDSSNSFIQSLKNTTKANVTERLDGLAREASIKNTKLTEAQIQEVMDDEFKKARAKMIAIAESESSKLRNLGTMMDITRIASDLGDSDPTVLFVVIRDNSTCKECIRLHLMPDGVTPRLWKFSELKQGYHKRGEDSPSAFGLHPHCRCTLTYLSQGFGFDKNGHVTYKGENYDAYSQQK